MEKILTPDSSTVLLEVMRRDQAEFFDLILQLADCGAAHAQAFSAALKSPIDEVWDEIRAGLHE